MEKLLIECCELVLKALDQALKDGRITKDEYEKEVKLKIKFLQEHAR